MTTLSTTIVCVSTLWWKVVKANVWLTGEMTALLSAERVRFTEAAAKSFQSSSSLISRV